MSRQQPNSSSLSEGQEKHCEATTAASDLSEKQKGSGTRLQQEDRPSQAEGDRDTVEDDLKDNSYKGT